MTVAILAQHHLILERECLRIDTNLVPRAGLAKAKKLRIPWGKKKTIGTKNN